MSKNNNYFGLVRIFIITAILVMITISCEQKGNEKTATSEVDLGAGTYTLPYELPNIDSIKNVMAKVRDYFYANTQYRVVDSKTRQTITDFSQINPNADLDKGENGLFEFWVYPAGVTNIGMLKAGEVTGDNKYTQYPIKNLNFFFDNLAYFKKIDSVKGRTNNSYRRVLHMGSLDDCGAMGASLIKAYKITKDPRFLPVINDIADYISNKQFRLADGTLARQRPQPQSLWADDAFMCVPFLAQMGSLTGETKYYNDAIKQIVQMSKYLFRWDKKLYDHGLNLNNQYDPNFYWARANGWVIMAINELLDVLPENYKGRDEVLKILRSHVQGLAEVQGGDGLWHNLLDKTDSFIESTSTAMFVYGIAHAINKGWIDYTFGPVAQAGWNALATRVTPQGQVNDACWGTTLASDNVYYYHRPVGVYNSHGYGPVLYAGAGMIELLKNDKITVQLRNRTYHYRLKSDLENIKD